MPHERSPRLFDFLAEFVSFLVFDKRNVDGCPQLTLFRAPFLVQFIRKVVDALLLFDVVVVNDEAAFRVPLFEEVFKGTFAFINVEIDVLDPLHLRHLSDVVHHIQVGVSPCVKFFVKVRVRIFVMIFKGNWLRELHE